MKPPNRSSVWRFKEYAGQNPPPNYSDMELFCGGKHQDKNPGDQCGLCGDPVNQGRPRDNEYNGKYYRGIVTGNYAAGQVCTLQ